MTDTDSMPVTFEKARLNVWHVGTVVVAIMSQSIVAAVVWNDTKRDIAETQSDVSGLQDSVADIQKQIPQIAGLQFQMTRTIEQIAENKASVAAANARIDRVVESFGGKLDTVIESVNKLATRVEVLNSRFEDASKTQKTDFRPTYRRP